MIYAIFTSLITLFVIFGYSFFFKKYLLKKKDNLYNVDIFYGLIFLLFISLISNIFISLNYFTLPIYIVGLIFFLIGFKKDKIQINFFTYSILILIFTFTAFYNSNNIDSPMYHMQTLKWMSLNKITFGLVNLEIRLGMNSSWHSILSLLDGEIKNLNTKFYFNAVIVSVLFYEAIQKNSVNLKSKIFIILSCLFLIIFSLIHPFNNGIILNHLGNPERDIFAMVSYIFVFYFFIKCFENNFEDVDLINLLMISIFLSATSRISTLAIVLIPILIYLFIKKIKIINFTNFFILFSSGLWIFRNFVLSGCLIFPVKFTCFDTDWSVNINEMNYMVKEAMGLTRDAPFKTRHLDFDYTINSFDWFMPWIKHYFLQTSFIQIGLLLILISIVLIFVSKDKITLNNKKFYIIFLIPIIINFFIWFKAPEVRYAWGNLISFPCSLLLFAIFQNNNLKNLLLKNLTYIRYCLFLFIFLFFSKNLTNFNKDDIFSFSNKDFDYTNIIKIGNYDGYDIYRSKNWQCADFKEICVNLEKKGYRIKLVKNYLFFLKFES